MNSISEVVCGGCDEPMLCCCARIDLGFFRLFNCVIRWPVLCHYGAQAWVEAAGGQGSALSLSQRSSSACPPLSFCPSVCVYLSVCIFVCSLSLSVFHTSTIRVYMQMSKCKFSPQAQVRNFNAVPPFLHVLMFPAVEDAVSGLLKPMRWS